MRLRSHDTIRPVKRLDSAGSHRASAEFVGSARHRASSSSGSGSHRSTSSLSLSSPSTAETTPDPSNASSADSGHEARLGRALVDEVVGPVIENLTAGGDRKGKGPQMDARDIEALSMVRKGFEDLAESNPGLAWQTVADLLGGINECVPPSVFSFPSDGEWSGEPDRDVFGTRNAAIKQSLSNTLSSTAGVSDLIKKNTIMTDRGPAVLLSSVHGKSAGSPFSESDDEDEDELGVAGRAKKEEPRSPIAQMLYARWVLNLREQREFSLLGCRSPIAR